jgi:hypothetical protein
MAMLTYRDPLLAAPYRMMDELLRGWNANQAASFAPLLDVRETEGRCQRPGFGIRRPKVQPNDT